MSRSSKYTQEQLEEVHRLVRGGLSVSQACKKEGVTRGAYYRFRDSIEQDQRPPLQLHPGGKKRPASEGEPAESPNQVLDRKILEAFSARARAAAEGDQVAVYHADLEIVFFGSLKNASFASALQARMKLAELQRVDKPMEEVADPFASLSMEEIELLKDGRIDELPAELQEQLLAAAGT